MSQIKMTNELQAALIRLRDAYTTLQTTPMPTGIIRGSEKKQAEYAYIFAADAWRTAAEIVTRAADPTLRKFDAIYLTSEQKDDEAA